MTRDECLARYGLVPKLDDLPSVRDLLRKEMRLQGAGEDRHEDVALVCAVQLFSRGLPDDVLLISQAKQSSFDLSEGGWSHGTCTVDVTRRAGAARFRAFRPERQGLAESCPVFRTARAR